MHGVTICAIETNVRHESNGSGATIKKGSSMLRLETTDIKSLAVGRNGGASVYLVTDDLWATISLSTVPIVQQVKNSVQHPG